MTTPLPLALFAALVLTAPAFAADPPPETQATAQPTSASADDTAAQIDAFLKAAPPVKTLDDGVDGVTDTPVDRKPHGVVEVSVGSRGYRSVYLESTYPIGETGSLTIALSDSKGGGYYGGYYGGDYGSAYDRYLGSPLPQVGDRQVMGVGLSIGTNDVRAGPGNRERGFGRRPLPRRGH